MAKKFPERLQKIALPALQAAKGVLGLTAPSAVVAAETVEPIIKQDPDLVGLDKALAEIRTGDPTFRTYIDAFQCRNRLQGKGLTPDINDIDIEADGIDSWYKSFRLNLRYLGSEYRLSGTDPSDERLLGDLGMESASMYLCMSFVLPDPLYRGNGTKPYTEPNVVSIADENRPEALTLVRAWMLGSALNRSGHTPRVRTVYSTNNGYHFANAFFATDLSLEELRTGVKPDVMPDKHQKLAEAQLLTFTLRPDTDEYRDLMRQLRASVLPDKTA